ncbi:MAG: 5'/3'-nucleotidase SurE [Deltaproteobacteria bacterium]|nr:5'/3'-nucleotidase SurE [Deltaproteobacteria bacterium]
MHILLTNDDGFFSDGLLTAYSALRSAGHRVTVCAPDRERSAQSQSVTLNKPIEVLTKPLPDGVLGYCASGTPADCARLGFTTLAGEPVDLVISGINNDTNLGFDVNYSGTVAAALEAAGERIPAIAASLERSAEYDWTGAGEILAGVVSQLSSWAVPLGVMLNLNIPHKPADRNPVWTRAYEIPAPDYFEKKILPEGLAVYTRRRGSNKLKPAEDPVRPEPDNDVALLKSGYITISPIITASTHLETLNRLRSWNASARPDRAEKSL